MKNQGANSTLSHLKQAPLSHLKEVYDRTDIPVDVYNRIWSHITTPADTPVVVQKSWSPRWVFSTLAICWFGALIALFAHYAKELETATKIRDSKSLLAKVVQTNGYAEIRQDNEKLSAESGMHLANTSALHTFSGKAVIEVGRHRIKVERQSSFGIRELNKQKMSFNLLKGAVELEVEKLPKSSTLSVQSGRLTVSVVGTMFRVDRTQGCTTVNVKEGRVRAEFDDQIVYISAGGHEEFCEAAHRNSPLPGTASQNLKHDPPPEELHREEAPASTPTLDEETDSLGQYSRTSPRRARKKPLIKQVAETARTAEDDEVDTMLTAEEQLIKQAHFFIAQDKRQEALSHLETYIAKYPSGLFSEEALFNAIRQSYWLKQMTDVIRYSEIFLDRNFKGGYKSLEIRILRAEALLTLNTSPEKALDSLEPVINRLDTVSNRYRGQALYLYVLGAHRSGQLKKSAAYARQYLDRFPDGRYRDAIERMLDQSKQK